MEELGVEGNQVTLKGYTFNKTVKTGTSKSTYKPPPEQGIRIKIKTKYDFY